VFSSTIVSSVSGKGSEALLGVVLTVMNMKGGVGKTTVSTHIAGVASRYALNGKPRHVLAIDYDPQFNMSQAFLPAKQYFALETERRTTLSILVDDDTALDPYKLQVPGNHIPPNVEDLASRIYTYKDAALDLIPSTLDLMYVALGQATAGTLAIEERFRKFIIQCRGKYDLTIIDCHPAGSLFTKTSLTNSDHVLIPVVPQRYAVRGIGLMTKFITAKSPGGPAPTPHILFNAVPRTGVTHEETQIRADLNFAPSCMKSTLKRYKAFSEPEGGRNFVWVSGRPYSTEALGNLIEVSQELMTRIKA
jgi:chromosome partitioning protein